MKRNRARGAAGLALALSLTSATFAVDSIGDLRWCPESRDCLEWSPSAGADHYNVYRGGADELAALLGATTDSCTLGSYDTATSGTFADATPSTGDLQWYLVGAVDPGGVESTGDATAGARSVDSSGDCGAPATLVLNEVDYDQAGSDTAEFVEIHNPASVAQDLTGIALVLINGTTGAEYARVALTEAAASLPAGAFLVVGAPGIEAGLPAGTPYAAFGSASNNIQNGAPDGVALIDTAAGTLLDALSYEGSIEAATVDGIAGSFSLVEGTPTSEVDSNSATGALARFPDGRDTGDAAADWFFVNLPTPGAANPIP